jgi:hypothetical protein
MLAEEIAMAEQVRKDMQSSLTGDDLHVRERLIKHGVHHKMAELLVKRHGRDAVARQIAYLPHRKNVKSPAKILVSSIEGDWDAPLPQQPE